MTILERVKTSIELEGIDAYDSQVLESVNSSIAFLNNCNIPVEAIDDTTESFPYLEEVDVNVALKYLVFDALIDIDKTMQGATVDYLEDRKSVLLNQLKAKYDIG